MAMRKHRTTSSAKILDTSARYRRQKKALEALEQDNFNDEPHADLVMSKKVPKFQESNDKGPAAKKKEQRSMEYYKLKFRKQINTLIEEEQLENLEEPNDSTAAATTSKFPPRASSSLLENFLQIKSRYDSSVRLFPHDLRNGKYEENTALHLYVRKIVDRQDKLTETIAYDMKEHRDRWILFKSGALTENIAEKTFLRLYPPWQEVVINGMDDTIIIGTDFFKTVRGSKLSDEVDMNKHGNTQLHQNFSGIRISDPMFLDLVPDLIKNQNNIRPQVDSYQFHLNIDVVILYAWTHISPALVLIKDSTDFMSFLEIPSTEIKSSFQPGQCFKLLRIGVAEKICISKNLVPFSIMYLFGGRQTFFYSLKWQQDSQREHESVLNVAYNDFKKDLVNIDDIFLASTLKDHRISIKCKIREKQDDYILVTDEDSDRSLRIEFVWDTNYQSLSQNFACETNVTVLLRFIRVIHGKTIWDLFTIWEEVLDEEDPCDCDSY